MSTLGYLGRFVTGDNATQRLGISNRAAMRIADYEHRAEFLISIIKLCIVLLFALLYASSPKLGDPDKQFITPMILGIYIFLNLIGLAWVLRARLPDWAVYASIVMDISLLYGLIWSFHVVYLQPPSFYLKAPTLLYVFIFIALRALRFQARFVIVTGLFAAVGWILMFLYVIVYDEFDTMVTRDFIIYLTSNSILIGAEIDKIISMLVVTGLVAVSISRARRMLIHAAYEEDTAYSLSRYFDQGVVKELKQSDFSLSHTDGVAREAAILNVDLRAFSIFAQNRPPDDVIAVLKTYQMRVVPIIQEHGGSIDKFMGDGILATFGAVQDSDTACADAMRTIEAILADVGNWKDDHKLALLGDRCVGMSVAYGTVVFGAVGDEQRLELTVIGSTVNLGAKLEKHNKVLGSTAICTSAAFDTALEQGFAPRYHSERQLVELNSVAHETEVVVYSSILPASPRAATDEGSESAATS